MNEKKSRLGKGLEKSESPYDDIVPTKEEEKAQESAGKIISTGFRLPADLVDELKVAVLVENKAKRARGKKIEGIGQVVTRAIRKELDRMIKRRGGEPYPKI